MKQILRGAWFLLTFTVFFCQAEEFDTKFLVGNAEYSGEEQSDTSGFRNGIYFIDIYVNDKHISEKETYLFKENEKIKGCLTKEDIVSLGIMVKKNSLKKCEPISVWVNGSVEKYDERTQSLYLNIPENMVIKNDKYKTSPVRWDYGDSIFFTNYVSSISNSLSVNGRSYNAAFLDLDNGYNVGPWQIRSHATAVSAFDKTKTYLRDLYLDYPLPEKQVKIRTGKSFYSDEGLDSFSYKGLRLSTDDSMLNQDSVKYGPVVEGIITSQAKIVVLQQQNIIYQGVFPPGRYKINELKLVNDYDSLNVYVDEAGKPVYHFSVPVHAASGLLRPGREKWSMTSGETDFDQRYYQSARFLGLSYTRGVTDALSLNAGGLLLSNRYMALTSGALFYTKFGFLSGKTSLTKQAQSKKGSENGFVLNGSYSKSFEKSGISLSAGITRYSESGTTSAESSLIKDKNKYVSESFFYPAMRNEYDISINKSYEYGEASVQSSTVNYYHSQNNKHIYSMSYQHFFRKTSITLSLNKSINDQGPSENSYGLSFSIPLIFSGKTYSNDTGLSTSRGSVMSHVGTSSTFGYNDKNNFNVYGGRELSASRDKNQELGGSINLDNFSNNITLGAVNSERYRQLNASSTGSLVVHKDGITFGKTLGSSFALVEAPDAGGAEIDNGHSTINSHGYALVPSLVPYADNMINISSGKMNDKIEIPVTSKSVVPVSGATLRVHFPTISGIPVLVKVLNKKIPTGLTVRNKNGIPVGMTGISSMIYLRQITKDMHYSIRWGDNDESSCNFELKLSSSEMKNKFLKLDKSCD